LHLTETLATKLRFTAERLLGNEAIWPNRTCVNLLINQVVKFQDVHNAYSYAAVKSLTSTSVIEPNLAVGIMTSEVKVATDFVFSGAVKYRVRKCNTLFVLFNKRAKLFV